VAGDVQSGVFRVLQIETAAQNGGGLTLITVMRQLRVYPFCFPYPGKGICLFYLKISRSAI
jgi:hypothetical protein